MTKDSKPRSYHIFMFPFAWDYFHAGEKGTKPSFEDRTDLLKFNELLSDSVWKPVNFGQNLINYYNDFAFFHTSVREAVFGKQGEGGQMVLNYERVGAKGGSYEIKLTKRTAAYRLHLEQIRLNVYDTGIGILSFFISNHDYPEWKEVLEINDYGRRIYPQFLDTQSEGKGGSLLSAAHEAFLAEKIQMRDVNGGTIFSEDFSYVHNLLKSSANNSGNWSLLSDKLVQDIFGNAQFTSNNELDGQSEQAVINVAPILDDRMFVVTWYGNTEAAYNLKTTYQDPNQVDDWMQYIFVDNSGNTCQSTRMRLQLMEQHTYDRWADYGTFYGISRYSMVALTDESDFAHKHLVQHIKGRYYELAQLSLAQRASCQRFSQEINTLASLSEKPMKEEADFLYKEYLRFINKLYFPEASPQEQGIELYELLQRHMKIAADVAFLKSELTDLYEFLNLRQNMEQSKAANQFAWVATIFLPATLVATVFGFSTITENMTFWNNPPDWKFWIPLGLTILTILLAQIALRKFYRKKA